ncbi:MAG: hypothetical protein HC827_06500 [Cyanobacteria bacterium RM1_2_2]|nr:hypothetical protein [Cyanobacteria bacterium RM1_2_2]
MPEDRVNPYTLLQQVKDKQTFIQFVQALALEREQAEAIEREDPNYYRVNGALGWENGDIASFLWAALEYFKTRPLDEQEAPLSWAMFAEFLYFGKLYE